MLIKVIQNFGFFYYFIQNEIFIQYCRQKLFVFYHRYFKNIYIILKNVLIEYKNLIKTLTTDGITSVVFVI